MTDISQLDSHAALSQVTARYEALVRDFGLLRQLDEIQPESAPFDVICTRLVSLIALEGIAEYCSIMLLDADGSYLELRAVATRYSTQGFAVGSDSWRGKRFALGEGIAGRVAATGVHLRINDTLAEPGFLALPDSPVTVRSLMCFPLKYRGELLGVINLSQGVPSFFDIDREQAMFVVTRRIASILGPAHQTRWSFDPDGRGEIADEGSTELSMLADGDGNILQISANCASLTGISAAEWLSRGVSWRSRVVEPDRALFDAYRAAGMCGGANNGVSYSFAGPDGITRQFHELALPCPDAAHPGAIFVTVRDVSKREILERWSANHAASKLLHAQRMHTLGQLAGGVVHDLNNLMTGIVGSLDLALVSDSNSRVNELIARARKASLRSAEIVNKVLVFGRAGTTEDEPHPFPVSRVLEEAASVLSCSFDPRINFEVSVPEGHPKICGNPEQLNHALVNLCVNARDALEQRGLNGEQAGAFIRLGAEQLRLDHDMPGPWGEPRRGVFVRLWVADNGCGMPPGVLARMYEPFFSTKPAEKGTGLGLATVYKIVRHHRGWLDVHSTPQRGTTFNIYLPAYVEAVPVEPETAAPGASETGDCVLLVDDESLVRNLGIAILRRLGYTPLAVSSGGEAVETFTANRDRIRAVILDLNLPDMGGEGVMKALRAISPGVPVIYSSGMNYTAAQDLPPELTPTGFLKKPYLIATMAEVIRECLAGRR